MGGRRRRLPDGVEHAGVATGWLRWALRHTQSHGMLSMRGWPHTRPPTRALGGFGASGGQGIEDCLPPCPQPRRAHRRASPQPGGQCPRATSDPASQSCHAPVRPWCGERARVQLARRQDAAADAAQERAQALPTNEASAAGAVRRAATAWTWTFLDSTHTATHVGAVMMMRAGRCDQGGVSVGGVKRRLNVCGVGRSRSPPFARWPH